METYTNTEQMEKGKAVPLVIFSDKRFIITDEAAEIFCKKEYKNIGIISLVGKYRTGKSFLLNRVLLNQKKASGFDVGPTIRPCTKGIWMWSNPIYIENNHCKEKFPVFMIDTEGLGAYDEEINHDSKIFLIAVLISSLFIYNSFGNIDENSINSLSFILNLSKTIKLKENSGGNTSEESLELAKYFPSLLWLLRDFSLKLEDSEGNTITAKQYLENALQFLKGSSGTAEEKNKVRKMITTYFSERDCFSMVRPVEEEKDLQNLQSLDDSKIRKEFLEQADILRHKVSKKVKPKMFNNSTLTGSMLVELLRTILNSINQGSVPVIESSWKYIIYNESVKNMNGTLKSYTEQILKFKEENKENPSFFTDLETFQKNLDKKLTEEFLKSTIMDESSSVEFIGKLKSKMAEEYKKFNEENSKFFKGRMLESLEKNTKKLVETFETDKYAKNYYQFFQDLENLKEITEASTPDFAMKKEIIFEKLLLIIKKFIEMTFLKNKILNEKEIVTLKNEIQGVNKKLNIQLEEYESLKAESKEIIEKLNNQIVDLKIKDKNFEEKVKQMEHEKKNIMNSNEKKTSELKRDIEETAEKMKKEYSKLEADLKSKEDQILTLKFAEEKMTSLNVMKSEFMEKEIASHKERYEQLKKDTNEYRATIDELNNKIDELKADNSKKKIVEYELERYKMNNVLPSMNMNYNFDGVENNPNMMGFSLMPSSEADQPMMPCHSPTMMRPNVVSRNSNPYLNNMSPVKNPNSIPDNSELVSLLKFQLESAKSQMDESKKMYEEIISAIKNNTLVDKDLLESNKTLTQSISTYESRCSSLEETISKLKSLKKIMKFSSALQCKFCSKFYSYDIFKLHITNCQQEMAKNSNDNLNKKQSLDKLKIKILKGVLNKDELEKPFIEYIVEITYNTHNWRVNKKFNHFANLHKSLVSLFPDFQFPESSNIFSKINMNGKDSNNYHENKIKFLENYLKDISEIAVINKSRAFRKFFEFDDNIEEEGNSEVTGNFANTMPVVNFGEAVADSGNLNVELDDSYDNSIEENTKKRDDEDDNVLLLSPEIGKKKEEEDKNKDIPVSSPIPAYKKKNTSPEGHINNLKSKILSMNGTSGNGITNTNIINKDKTKKIAANTIITKISSTGSSKIILKNLNSSLVFKKEKEKEIVPQNKLTSSQIDLAGSNSVTKSKAYTRKGLIN